MAIIIRIEAETKHYARITKWHIQRALRWITAEDLQGLGCIRILDHESADPQASTQPPYLRGFVYLGHYYRKSDARLPEIHVFTKDLYYAIPKFLALSPIVTLEVATTIAHEVAHHLIELGHLSVASSTSTKTSLDGRKPNPQEEAADSYAAAVVTRMLQTPYYKFGKIMATGLSNIYFRLGLAAHKNANFKEAASLHYRAYIIDRDNDAAGQCYLRDREDMLSKTPSSLTDAERLWIYHRRAARR